MCAEWHLKKNETIDFGGIKCGIIAGTLNDVFEIAVQKYTSDTAVTIDVGGRFAENVIIKRMKRSIIKEIY